MAEENTLELGAVFERLSMDPEKVTTLEEFNTAFEGKFFTKKQIKADKGLTEGLISDALGNRMGTLQTVFKRDMKGAGFELLPEDTKDEEGKPIPLEQIFSSTAEKIKAHVEEIQKTADQGDDEKVKELTEKLKRATSDFKEVRESAKELTLELEQVREGHAKEFKQHDIRSRKDELIRGISLVDNISDISKEGLEARLDKLNWDIDENDKFVVTDADGNLFMDEKGFDDLTPKQAVDKIADDAGLLKKNNAGEGQKPEAGHLHIEGDDKNKREVSSVAQQQKEKLGL